MCAPGLKVSVGNPDERVLPSKLRGNSQMAPKTPPKAEPKTTTNPLSIPLKVPGIG